MIKGSSISGFVNPKSKLLKCSPSPFDIASDLALWYKTTTIHSNEFQLSVLLFIVNRLVLLTLIQVVNIELVYCGINI